jgi:hypothetical protein
MSDEVFTPLLQSKLETIAANSRELVPIIDAVEERLEKACEFLRKQVIPWDYVEIEFDRNSWLGFGKPCIGKRDFYIVRGKLSSAGPNDGVPRAEWSAAWRLIADKNLDRLIQAIIDAQCKAIG